MKTKREQSLGRESEASKTRNCCQKGAFPIKATSYSSLVVLCVVFLLMISEQTQPAHKSNHPLQEV